MYVCICVAVEVLCTGVLFCLQSLLSLLPADSPKNLTVGQVTLSLARLKLNTYDYLKALGPIQHSTNKLVYPKVEVDQ